MNFILLSDVSLDTFRSFLLEQGYRFGFVPCGHEQWCKEGKLRPVVLRAYADPVPAYIVMNALRSMGVEVKELLQFLDKDNYSIKKGPDVPALS